MANPYAVFKTDPEMEVNGVYLDYGDFRVKIARAGGENKKFMKLFNTRTKPLKLQMASESVDENVAEAIMIETYVDSVILDMDVKDKVNSTRDVPVYVQGILDPDDNIIPFNRDNAIQMFRNLPELFKDIQGQSNSIALFRMAAREDEIKNSPSVSSGD